jgi:hypothetical protein
MKTRLLAGVSMLALALGGCATIISGSNQTLTVNTNVPGAQVLFNNIPIGVTPLIVSVKRGQEGVLSVQAPGYQPFQAPITKKVNGLFFVNILSGGTFGSTTDYTTGAMYAYEPDTYYVTLQPMGLTPGGMAEWKRREEVRSFVLLNNEALATELAAGRGEYVDALVALLEVKAAERGAAVQRWQASYRASETAVAFADRMVGELPAHAAQ